MSENLVSTAVWEDIPVDISKESEFIWSIANKLRGVYMPDKYGDVIIPMTIIRRFESVLEKTKDNVVETFENNRNYPEKAMYRILVNNSTILLDII